MIKTITYASWVVQRRVKKIQDSGQPPSWKIEKQSYLGNGLTNRHHSWYADALWPYEPYRQLKIWNSKIQNGGRRDGRYVNKKLSYRWETARRAILENSCYASRSMEIRKFSNSKSDIHCHSRALEMVPFNRPHAISIILPLQLCLLKRSRDPEHILFGVINHACNSTPLINQHTTFEVPSFTDSKDDWGKVKFKKRVTRPWQCPFRGGLSSISYDLIPSTCVQNLTILYSAVPEIWLVPPKFKWFTTWPRPFREWFVIREQALATIDISTTFEVFISTNYEEMKSDTKYRQLGGPVFHRKLISY